MTINITPEVIITSYIITTISHLLFWVTWRGIKQASKGISDEYKLFIKYHTREHGGKLVGCKDCATGAHYQEPTRQLV